MLNKLTKLIPIQYTKLDPSIKGRSFGVLIQIDEKYKEDKVLHSKMDAYHRRLDTHGDDLVRLNTNIKQIKRNSPHLSISNKKENKWQTLN